MKTKVIKREMKLMQRFGYMAAVLLAAASVLVYAPAADADMVADAVIINVVSVDYTDASGNNAFQAEAAATVTVNLVEAGVIISGRPTPSAAGDSAVVPAEQTVTSGSTASYLYALTSNANGDDVYFLDIAIDAFADVTAQSITTQLLSPDEGTVLATNPASVILGASTIVAVSAPDTLLFPGGTLTDIVAGDVVVINNQDFLVSSVINGSPANYAAGVLTPEVQGQLVLTENTDGGNITPAFGAGDIATQVYEQVLVSVQVYAEANVAATDGTVDVDIVAATDAAISANLSDVQDWTTTYTGLDLAIVKEVRNVTNSGAFAPTATGVTGDVLEYRVTIDNNGGIAANVIVTDAVPDYTTLVVAGGNFASYIDPVLNTGTVSSGTDNENADDVSGDHTGTAAGVPLTFYVGQGQSGAGSTGGSVNGGETFVITYQVSID